MDGLGLIVVGTENYNIIIEVGWFQEENMLYIASQDDEAVLLEDPEPDSWYHFSLSYDMLSGEITGRVDDGISCTLAGTPGMVPEVFDFSSLMESQIAIDNVIIEAIFNNHIGLFEGTAHTDETIVSPNPASNFLQLEHSKTPAEALVYDLNGKLLEKHTHTKRIPIHSLNAGVYLLEIKFKEGVSEWVKFVKE